MNKSEVISTFRKEIENKMVNLYRIVLNCNGEIQYQMYIWENGEIETLEGCQGDNNFLKAKDGEQEKLFYIATIKSPCFYAFDYTYEPEPEDETEREIMRQQIIDYLVDEYEHNSVPDFIDCILEHTKEYGW